MLPWNPSGLKWKRCNCKILGLNPVLVAINCQMVQNNYFKHDHLVEFTVKFYNSHLLQSYCIFDVLVHILFVQPLMNRHLQQELVANSGHFTLLVQNNHCCFLFGVNVNFNTL